MIGTVESLTKSKSGKSWRVKISGKYYGASFDSHLDKEVGKAIDFIYSTGDFGDWIDSWAYAKGAPQAAQEVANRVLERNAERTERLAEPELRFVSNVVGSAIMAKSLTDPQDIGVWAKAAAAAVKEI